MNGFRPWLGLCGAALLWGCSSESSGPALKPCTASSFAVSLAVGEYVAIDPSADSGCVIFPANATGSEIEYLLVPQLATGVPGQQTGFRLTGDTVHPSPVARRDPGDGEPSPAAAFHTFLRDGDHRRFWGFAPQRILSPSPSPNPPAAQAGPPAYGSQRTFNVCARLNCSVFENVTATVRAVKSDVVIYVDNAAPANGLDSTALDSLAALMDTVLYAVDTAAFGRESDIDTNSVILVVMTAKVNRLVDANTCQSSGFVAGFFLGADIDPAFQSDPRSNKGEIFYSLVADPSSTLPSCAHSKTEVEQIIPITFIHEFQHMISYNQHVLVRGGPGEVLWLNEGFSHYAEELGGRQYASGSPQFSRFNIGNLANAYDYLDSTRFKFLLPTAGIGSLPERGAAWLFVRYLVDQHSGGTTIPAWNTFTRQLVQTSQTGAQNVANVAGVPFTDIVTRWALANWVSDLPAFATPSALQYNSWGFRGTYASLNSQAPSSFPKAFPLTPTQSTGTAAALQGTLHAGSGFYHRVTQAAGAAAFTTLFSTPGGGTLNAGFVPRLNVIRIK